MITVGSLLSFLPLKKAGVADEIWTQILNLLQQILRNQTYVFTFPEGPVKFLIYLVKGSWESTILSHAGTLLLFL